LYVLALRDAFIQIRMYLTLRWR